MYFFLDSNSESWVDILTYVYLSYMCTGTRNSYGYEFFYVSIWGLTVWDEDFFFRMQNSKDYQWNSEFEKN